MEESKMGKYYSTYKFLEWIIQDLINNQGFHKKSCEVSILSKLISNYSRIDSVKSTTEFNRTSSTMLFDDVFFRKMLDEINDFSSISKNHVKSVFEAFAKVYAYLNTRGQDIKKVYFRGQSNETHNLNSRLSRNNKKFTYDENNLSSIEKKLMDDFKKDIKAMTEIDKSQIFSNIPDDSQNWWAMMQHYPFKGKYSTRMIDITDSILVGLYFACDKWEGDSDEVGDPESDGKLFVLRNVINEIELKGSDIMKVFKKLKHEQVNYLIRPTLVKSRMIRQNGLFLTSKYVKDSYVLSSDLELIIDKNSKQRIIDELKVFGICKEYLKNEWSYKNSNNNNNNLII